MFDVWRKGITSPNTSETSTPDLVIFGAPEKKGTETTVSVSANIFLISTGLQVRTLEGLRVSLHFFLLLTGDHTHSHFHFTVSLAPHHLTPPHTTYFHLRPGQDLDCLGKYDLVFVLVCLPGL